MSNATHGNGSDCFCGSDCICVAACDCCVCLKPRHVEATVAGVNAVETALRDPTEDDIPRLPELSILQRLKGILLSADNLEYTVKVQREETKVGHVINEIDRLVLVTTCELATMVAEKLEGVVRDMSPAEAKGNDHEPE